MSAYRSDLPQLERRIEELERELGDEDDAAIVVERRRRDARSRLAIGLLLAVVGSVCAFLPAGLLGEWAGELRRGQDATFAAADARFSDRFAAEMSAKARLDACTRDLGKALAGRGVVEHWFDGLGSMRGVLAPFAAPVLTCRHDPTDLTLTFAADGHLEDITVQGDGLTAEERACIGAAIAPARSPSGAHEVRATFALP